MLLAMVDEPIVLHRVESACSAREGFWGTNSESAPFRAPESREGRIRFDRPELKRILNTYGRMVMAGEGRDYAIDFRDEVAVFSIFRRSSEMPLYSIEKRPRLKERQGQYSVVAAGGQVLKRGHDLHSVLRVLERKLVRFVAAE
jgi:Protein of unknown function (DUF2794)